MLFIYTDHHSLLHLTMALKMSFSNSPLLVGHIFILVQVIKSAGSSATATTLKLDIELKAPLVILPRFTHSKDAACAALGRIKLESSPVRLKPGYVESL